MVYHIYLVIKFLKDDVHIKSDYDKYFKFCHIL
jgi:hypothetical protein